MGHKHNLTTHRKETNNKDLFKYAHRILRPLLARRSTVFRHRSRVYGAADIAWSWPAGQGCLQARAKQELGLGKRRTNAAAKKNNHNNNNKYTKKERDTTAHTVASGVNQITQQALIEIGIVVLLWVILFVFRVAAR